MSDREKVIASLDNALVQMHGCGRYTPKDVDELETAAWKALELLEGQEAKSPVVHEKNGYWNYVCPTCGSHGEEFFREWNYCPFCGQAVKWE